MQRRYPLQLLDLFRVYQQKGKFIGSAYETDLSLSEAFALIELDVDATRTATELASILQLTKSSISRILSSLESRGYIRTATSSTDRRGKELTILKPGYDFLSVHDRFNDAFIEGFLKNISAKEQKELNRYLRMLVDGLGAAPLDLRPGEHPMLIEIRRFTRISGALGRSFCTTEFSTTEWQIYSEIEYGTPPVTAADLTKLFSMSSNTLAHHLTRLHGLKHIDKRDHPTDSRMLELVLTAEGKRTLRQFEDTAERYLRQGLPTLSAKEWERFINLFKKYIGFGVKSDAEGRSSVLLQNSLEIKLLTSEEERREARSFLVLQLLRRGLALSLPESFIKQNNISYVILSGNSIQGVCEFDLHGRTVSIVNLAIRGDVSDKRLPALFLESSLNQLHAKTGLDVTPLIGEEYIEEILEEVQGTKFFHRQARKKSGHR